jgi:hypothetical protein
MHDDLYYSIDEAMIFGDTTKASKHPDPLASVNTSPVMKGRTVNFETTSPFRYGKDKNGYPNFNAGTYSVTHTYYCHCTCYQSRTFCLRPEYFLLSLHLPPTKPILPTPRILPLSHLLPPTKPILPTPRILSSSLLLPPTKPILPLFLLSLTKLLLLSLIRLVLPTPRILQPIKSILSLIKSILFLTKFTLNTSILLMHMSLVQPLLLILLRQRPFLRRMGRQCIIRQIVHISYRNHTRMISDRLDHI